jgi:hypothetical protein
MKWFKRSGERVSAKAVQKAKDNYVLAKRTGRMGCLKCNINHKVAEQIEKMTLREFASWSGSYAFRSDGE